MSAGCCRPFPHESTAKTGIRHLDATISMARRSEPGSAGGNFFITVGPMPSMDAKGAYAGYAAFGRVVSGMPVVRRILAKPTAGGSEAMRGQMIARPIRIVSARRLDGVAKPTGTGGALEAEDQALAEAAARAHPSHREITRPRFGIGQRSYPRPGSTMLVPT